MTSSLSESAEQSRKARRLDPLLIATLAFAFLFCLQGITWGSGRMLESQPDRNARSARSAAERLHDAAVSYVRKPRFRDLAHHRSDENRQSGNAYRIAVTLALNLGTMTKGGA